MPYFGELAALTTALCWSFTSLFFTESAKRIGAFRVNNIRLVMASLIYTVILLVTYGSIWPVEINLAQFSILALSALIGLVLGDLAGFKALVMLGPRLGTLLWSTAPIMVVVIAWIFLSEQLHPIQLLGIGMTLAGVAWVVTERALKNSGAGTPIVDRKTLIIGVALGLAAALGQGLGLVLSKQAMLYSGEELPAMPASFVRLLTAMVMSWMITGFRGKLRYTVSAIGDGKAMGLASGGSFFGPFLGVWMSMVAVVHIEAGIAATLNAMTPIMILPLVTMVYKEKVSFRAYLGAVISVAGVAILVLSDRILGWF